jgi:hypothetical protein
MEKLADIPIVGGLFHALTTYITKTAVIITKPFKFARQTDFNSWEELKRSTEYYVASVIVSYLIYIPVFIRSGTDVSQALFLIFHYLSMFIIALCFHVIFVLFGSKNRLQSTIITQNYLSGFYSPIGLLIGLPYLLTIQPKLL